MSRTWRFFFGLALLAGCATDPSAAPGSTGQAATGSRGLPSEEPRDPLWGNIVIPSPSPGDTNPLRVRTERSEVFYTVDLKGPRVITYITRRDEDKADERHKDDFLHLESDADHNKFEVVLTYKRFYPGHYTVTAYRENDAAPVGERNFTILVASPTPRP